MNHYYRWAAAIGVAMIVGGPVPATGVSLVYMVTHRRQLANDWRQLANDARDVRKSLARKG